MVRSRFQTFVLTLLSEKLNIMSFLYFLHEFRKLIYLDICFFLFLGPKEGFFETLSKSRVFFLNKNKHNLSRSKTKSFLPIFAQKNLYFPCLNDSSFHKLYNILLINLSNEKSHCNLSDTDRPAVNCYLRLRLQPLRSICYRLQ